MINCIAYDVEVLRNFFSITFVSINSYLKVFKDCVNTCLLYTSDAADE